VLDILLAGGHDEIQTANLRLPEAHEIGSSDSETWHAEPPIPPPPYSTPYKPIDAPRPPTAIASSPPPPPQWDRVGGNTLPGVQIPRRSAPEVWQAPPPPIPPSQIPLTPGAMPPPHVPRASSQMLPSYDVASAIARDQWARRVVWLVVLVLGSIIGISLAFIL